MSAGSRQSVTRQMSAMGPSRRCDAAVVPCPLAIGQTQRAIGVTLPPNGVRTMLDGNKVMITVALNGGMQQDRDGAIVPKQPDEIGEAAARCWEAGASVVHVHARGPDGKNSGDRAIYAEIIRQIRARSPILIQTTNGIGVRRDPATGQFIWPSDSERLGLLEIEPQQDLFGIAGGSADFHNPEGGYPEETPYVNSPQLLRRTIAAVYAKGSALEY